MGRVIAIGDIHGCASEFAELLNRINPQSDDVIIQIGDMVNRGPDSAAVLRIIRENNIRAILGNHERRLLEFRWRRDASILKKYDAETIEQLTPKDWEFLENLPLFFYNSDLQTVFVHGGFDPHSPVLWREQPASVVTTIQVIDQEGKPSKRSKAPEGRDWGDLWQGPPFVVYGHTPRQEVRSHPQAIGIDTACVYGGMLTACILPEQELIQVNAHEVYAQSKTLPQPVNIQ
ncbi:MAG: metallophosphoesterase [Opitutales bacterium]|nr:metallophosphoesterase [Opitutales bacterium]NRA28258.1 metallophosphoesterase [Opitutales bacterium]